jgi:prefoldin subunit 5
LAGRVEETSAQKIERLSEKIDRLQRAQLVQNKVIAKLIVRIEDLESLKTIEGDKNG